MSEPTKDSASKDYFQIPGGSIPPGTLDPTIAVLSFPSRAPDHLVASIGSSLDVAVRHFIASFSRRIRPIGGFYNDGEIATRRHEAFIPDEYIPREKPPLVTDERIEELIEFMGLNSPPGDFQRGFALDERCKEITPQFFLRNIKRVKFETNPRRPPFQIEIWRYPVNQPQDFPSQMVLTHKKPDLHFPTSSASLDQEQRERNALLMNTRWSENWGEWWNKTPLPRFDTTWFPTETIKVVRGRFANPAEAEAEEEAKRKGRKQSIHFSIDNPDGVWSNQFKL